MIVICIYWTLRRPLQPFLCSHEWHYTSMLAWQVSRVKVARLPEQRPTPVRTKSKCRRTLHRVEAHEGKTERGKGPPHC